MGSFFRLSFPGFRRRRLAVYLAFAWSAGLLLGSFFSVLSAPFSVSLMRMTLSGPVSIFGLLTILYLPLLFTAFAVYISQIWLIIPICFFKSLFFSFVAAGFLLLLPSGGWLLCFLLLFSDCLSIPILFFDWYRTCSQSRMEVFRSLAVSGIFLFVIGIADYYVISPFLIRLL